MEQLFNFFISSAYAQPAAESAPPGSGMSFFVMLGVFILFIYFAIWRPQNKRAREQANLLNSLEKGDEVITAGGLLGRISKIADQYITLSVSNNVDITLQKSSVVNVLPKGTLKTIE